MSRFGYTGQIAIPEAALWHYKARAYAPRTARFLQSDPIGYAAGVNLYAYVTGDPVNLVDPYGLYDNVNDHVEPKDGSESISVIGRRLCSSTACFSVFDTYAIANIMKQLFDLPGLNKEFTGGSGGGPDQVKVDKSCQNVPAAKDPRVQAAAARALASARRQDAEIAFFVSKGFFGGFSIGDQFTSGHRRAISRSAVTAMVPRNPLLFVHTHQNNPPPSPVEATDKANAARRGIPYAAIDKGGNLTCTPN